MAVLVIGLVVFLGIHSVSIVADPWRNRMAASMGEWAWKGLYSIVAVIGFVLIVWGYSLARYEPTIIYSPPPWMRHLTMLLMLPVFPLLLAAYLPGRIQAAVGHPMLAAVKLWAFAHLLANGMLADLLLFGGFLVWAAADRVSLKFRNPRPAPTLPAFKVNDAVAVVLGLALYAAFVLWLHGALIGMPLISRAA